MHTLHHFEDIKCRSQYAPKVINFRLSWSVQHYADDSVPQTRYDLQILGHHELLHKFSPVGNWSQRVPKHDFRHFWSSKQHIDGTGEFD